MMTRMPGHGPETSVDTSLNQSVSFAPPHPLRPAARTDRWTPVAVGAVRPGAGLVSHGALGDGMTGYPIQPAKVQVPLLRDETLARHRLLDWLATKVHHRVILVLADAGYGKTTLLADFSRRTRMRTLWYRLDDEDRDWISFLSHLVAAGRVHDPGFAPNTAALLSDLALGGPTREAATETFLRELPTIAGQGTLLILDDFHLVDESPDIRQIVREIIGASDRLSVVFASRRTPTIPFARLRASGEVADLGTDDLRFDADETSRLFAETYGRMLEPDVLSDVAAKTEGWAASLQLVQAALRDRSPAQIRHFVRGLSGADQELYDYLAEEVVGDLPEDLQQFLMRTSILQVVTGELAGVVAGIGEDDVASMTGVAERLTLLSRPPRVGKGSRRYHPLVREFLAARLRTAIGPAAVVGLHRRAALAATSQWRVAAYHFREAGDYPSVAATIADAIPEIMGGGQHGAAIEEIERVPEMSRLPVLDLVVSRMRLQGRDDAMAIELSRAVLDAVEPGTQESDFALLNLATLLFQYGSADQTHQMAERLAATSANQELRDIAQGVELLLDVGGAGSLIAAAGHLSAMAERQRGVHPHWFGVTMLNLSIVAMNQDEPAKAIEHAREAIDALEPTSSLVELAAALMALAYPLTLLGHLAEAERAIDRANQLDSAEAAFEKADLADSYTNPEAAKTLLRSLREIRRPVADSHFAIQTAWYLARRGRFHDARALLAVPVTFDGTLVAGTTGRLVTEAYIEAASGSSSAGSQTEAARLSAIAQGAVRWRRIAELIEAYLESSTSFDAAIASIGSTSPWHLTFVSDLVVNRLDEVSGDALSVVVVAADMHPSRWRFVLRDGISNAPNGGGLVAAQLLERIGDRSDVARLRLYSRRQRRLRGTSALGRALSRRLADRALIEDQGRVTIAIGNRVVVGASIRRKVLGLLCFLLTRPSLASTRDQVLDALWPDLDPPDALNSLNQTVYFLRRVLEEPYVEDQSPGYVHHNSDLIWLDEELVTSRSNQCRELIKGLPATPEPSDVQALADLYRGRFALDFEYEEWAAPYRDWLHASFLEIVERAVSDDLESGHFERGIQLARRVLDIDPNAEHVEVSLLRLYRASGAHAAAAEQYGHYATVMRDQLGIEPPSLEDL